MLVRCVLTPFEDSSLLAELREREEGERERRGREEGRERRCENVGE
jgi:hypothetical protein